MSTPGIASTSDARKRLAERTAERLTVQVTVDTDELREWADRHADMGNRGVAHILYAAAKDGETLTEQAIREAEKRGAVEALREAASDLAAEADLWAPRVPAPDGWDVDYIQRRDGQYHGRWAAVRALATRADSIAANAQGGDQ